MVHGLKKKKLDTLGGVGSLLGAVICIVFAFGHTMHESMWTVWVVMSILLSLNGLVMIHYVRHHSYQDRHA